MSLMWTPEIERRLRNPKPGGKVEAAIKAGVDIERLIENLKLTPEQRIERLQQELYVFEDGKHKRLEKASLVAASLCGEPLADFVIIFTKGIDYPKATDILNTLGDDFFVYEKPWHDDPQLRIAVARKPALERIFGWVIERKTLDNQIWFWETTVEPFRFPVNVENVIEKMNLSQPGSDDEGQFYKWD